MPDQKDHGISWTDATWNPTTGCDQVSPGCDHCYALTMAKRLKGMGQADSRSTGTRPRPGRGSGSRCTRIASTSRSGGPDPRRIFVNSMSDLFHGDVTLEFVARVWAVMALTPRHTYQVLTKRPQIARSMLTTDLFRERVQDHIGILVEDGTVRGPAAEGVRSRNASWLPLTAMWPLPNVWMGTSTEDQKRADLRIPALLGVPAAVRFLSMEPLLGPIDLRRYIDPERDCNCGVPAMDGAGQHAVGCRCFTQPDIGWVIVGGESGKDARPMHPDWARSLRDQCVAAGVPFHFKQWGEWAPEDQSPADTVIPSPCRWDEATGTYRLGKRKAGRLLDGRTWDEWPT